MPIDYHALKVELQNARYADLSAAQAAALLNTLSGARLPRGDIGRQKSIELLAPVVAFLIQSSASTDPAVSNGARFWLAAYDRLIAPIDIVHTGAPFVIGLAANLLKQGYMTQAEHDDFLSLEVSYWQAALNNPNAPPVSADDAHNALEGEW